MIEHSPFVWRPVQSDTAMGNKKRGEEQRGNSLAIPDISLVFAPCKVLNIRIMRMFNYNDMPHEVLEMASEYAIKESRSGRGLSHSQAMEKIKEQRGWK